ncbi:4-hydroxyphenylpyruvate dioxygenase [Aspergillus sclerotioniger CBS 115572]|uniref:4-hydroxyphenylpyruvate dioxygenase n=1 Tax=Aspergillus sclerotioniger CBS 115572 TaxID=1450535 RepID=A0A317VT00_9EURO|nr:4-hydroxyphenylpyruvate dioxygenase [Aspergillus sclerotioniger CBS 115572]PWY76147.1 4-hydroxyphenylpyruvate dioxygenase [Aspergillus sclerotioniger CBS 115572]
MLSNKQAIGTLSLGQHPSHTLEQKIRVASHHGFSAIELVYSDLQRCSDRLGISMLEAAERTKKLCADNSVGILSLAPFENFEGTRSPLNERLAVAKHWIDIARKLNASYMQVPAQYGQDASTDKTVLVSELQQLADLASAEEPVVSIAYEPMSWSIYCSTWETALDLVEAIDRKNLGLCLDTFHEATKLWGSPFESSGKYPTGDRDLSGSLQRFLTRCPLEKISYVQLSDGELFDPPFSTTHPWYLEGEAPQFTWSKHARPFPFEIELGGYLPVLEIVKAWVVEKGYTGWISMEVFDRRMRSEEFKPEEAGRRARESWRKLQEGLRSGSPKI